MLSIGISEEMINYKLRDKIEYELREIFKQAEKASGLFITDPAYMRFKLGKTSEMPMQFTIAKLDDDTYGTPIVNGIEYDDLSGKEFLEASKVYYEKLSELCAKSFGPRYKFRIVSKKSKRLVKESTDSKVPRDCITEIYAVLEYTTK